MQEAALINRSVTLAFFLATALILAGAIAFGATAPTVKAASAKRNRGAYEPVPAHLVEAWRA